MPIPTGKRVGRLQKQINITANRPEFPDTGRFFFALKLALQSFDQKGYWANQVA